MKYFEQHRWYIVGLAVVLIVGMYLGALARPGYDKVVSSFKPKSVYIAVGQDTRTPLQKAMAEEVAKYKKSPDYITLIEKIAVDHVGNILMIDIASATGEAQSIKESIEAKQLSQIEQHKLREINGVTDTTATQTIAIETKQGRR